MGIRVDRETFIDPVAVGSTAGGGALPPLVGATPPWQPRPFSTKEEYQISNALRLMAVPAEMIRAIRPPMINELFPRQFGYDTTPLTVEEVLNTDRWGPQLRSWTSGAPYVRRSSSEDEMWSGTSRNASDPSMNPGG